ncbi:hypothetical protein HY631_02485 [Candidatus Uhrbacteria bacterium]|nr:hypothetical protein [Candidatus Uhrbacteria bacterium]
MSFFMLAAFGCAVIHPPVGSEPAVVTYLGPARGAVGIIEAQDGRPYSLAQSALDKGYPVSLVKSKGFVGFAASPGYAIGPGLPGYVSADVVSTPGGWYMPTGVGSSLPPLGAPVADALPWSSIAKCPRGRDPATAAEQSACNNEILSDVLARMPKKK